MAEVIARKRYTTKERKKFTWEYVFDVPSNEFDRFGKAKRKQKTKAGFSTKKEALEEGKKAQKKYETHQLELNSNALVQDVIQYYLDYAKHEGRFAKGTIANYEGLLKNHLQMLANVPITKLTHAIIKSWRRGLSDKGASSHVYNDCVKLLKASFNYSIEEQQISVNPFFRLKKDKITKKLRKRFSTQQLKGIIASCLKHMPEYYCLFILATLTGMRLGEYSALKPSDIDVENKLIYVEKQYTRKELKNRTKTKDSTRIVQISDEVLKTLLWHIKFFNINKDDFMFKTETGLIVYAKWIERRFAKLLSINNFDEKFCRVHDLRGQFVDIMHYLGVSTEYISRAVGHSSVATTSRVYTQILKELPVEANKKMDKKLFG